MHLQFGRITAWVVGLGALLTAVVTVLTQAGDLPGKARALCEAVGICSPLTYASVPGMYHGVVRSSLIENGAPAKEFTDGWDLFIASISFKGDIEGTLVQASPG